MSIEERITKILSEHEYDGADGTPSRVEYCICDWEGDDHHAHVAQVLTTELRLTREDFRTHHEGTKTRYFTPWENA